MKRPRLPRKTTQLSNATYRRNRNQIRSLKQKLASDKKKNAELENVFGKICKKSEQKTHELLEYFAQ